jgi:hypothetical protein
VIDALERGVADAGRKADEPPGPPAQTDPAMNALKKTVLDHVDPSLSLTAEEDLPAARTRDHCVRGMGRGR